MSCASFVATRQRLTALSLSKDVLTLEQALDRSTTLVAAADLDTGRSLYRNKALVNITGWTSEDLNAAGGPRVHYANPEQWDSIVARGKARMFFDEDVVLLARGGENLKFRLRVIPVPCASGRIVGVFTLTR